MNKEEFIELLGEAFHAAFRKALGDSPLASEIWNNIHMMPDADWAAILEFVYECIKDEVKT
jgi:hypothetical protein